MFLRYLRRTGIESSVRLERRLPTFEFGLTALSVRKALRAPAILYTNSIVTRRPTIAAAR